jgi:hypothetical protein
MMDFDVNVAMKRIIFLFIFHNSFKKNLPHIRIFVFTFLIQNSSLLTYVLAKELAYAWLGTEWLSKKKILLWI